MSNTNNHKSVSQKGLLYQKLLKHQLRDAITLDKLTPIYKILNEAKKDYSTIHANYTDKTSIAEINRQMNYKQREWFEKWFGDVEP